MKVLFFLAFIFFTIQAKAGNYYFSSLSGNDSRSILQAQSPATPWKTINKLNSFFANLKPGDSVLFKTGETFTGNIVGTQSGTQAAPIVISAYGTSKIQPVFEYNLLNGSVDSRGRNIIYIANSKYVVIDGIRFTDPTIDSLNHSITANVGIAINIDASASYITLKNLNISLIGVGVLLNANNCAIQHCTIQNMRMVVNTPTNINNNDDFGANGIVVGGSSNTISNCYFKDLWAVSYDYGYDGGAIEVYGSLVNQNSVLYNTAINCNGFMELGSGNGGVASNNLVAYNLLINNGLVFVLHTNGVFGLGITNLQLFNNDIVETVQQFTKPPYLLDCPTSLPANIINMRNNIFWINTNVSVVLSNGPLSVPGPITHLNNIYHLNSGVLGFSINSSEVIVDSQTAIFNNTASANPALWDYSLLPKSIAIDFGKTVGLTNDFNGTLLSKGGSFPDAGMLEYISSGSTVTAGFYFFAGSSQNGTNYLRWQIPDGNLKSFEIERSTDSINFVKVNTVLSQTLGQSYLYHYIDIVPSNSTLFYYRIKAIQSNNATVFSNVISINNLYHKRTVVVIPNPFTGTVSVKLSQGMFLAKTIVIKDSTGQTMMTKAVNVNSTSIDIDLSSLKKGTYFLNIEPDNTMLFNQVELTKM
jgi:hypothetical protein